MINQSILSSGTFKLQAYRLVPRIVYYKSIIGFEKNYVPQDEINGIVFEDLYLHTSSRVCLVVIVNALIGSFCKHDIKKPNNATKHGGKVGKKEYRGKD